MPSKSERERWERGWEQMMVRMERQKKALTRLVLVNTETVAALHEIAGTNCDGSSCVERARTALDRIGAAAAAAESDVEELDGTPVEDPRRYHRDA